MKLHNLGAADTKFYYTFELSNGRRQSRNCVCDIIVMKKRTQSQVIMFRPEYSFLNETSDIKIDHKDGQQRSGKITFSHASEQ